MSEIAGFGKIFIFLGAILIVIGLIFVLTAKVSCIGRLPGDVCIKKGNFTLYFPLATSILISVILSLILIFVGRR